LFRLFLRRRACPVPNQASESDEPNFGRVGWEARRLRETLFCVSAVVLGRFPGHWVRRRLNKQVRLGALDELAL
jgi:hypothetical protein